MRELATCPVCGGAERTPVCEYNGLIYVDDMRSSELARADYALCHACGTAYASRRPEGEELRDLLLNFNENVGRITDYTSIDPMAIHIPLSDEQRASLRARFAHGWLTSEESPPPKEETLPGLAADRMNHIGHLDMLASSIDLKGKRVLEIRSKTGWLLQALRDWFGCEVSALPAFEALQTVITDFYGVRADALIDFENFEIPYEGEFDLIIAKHMITHAIHPDAFLDTVRERLAPGGHAFFYTENDDATMARRGKDMFHEMKVFHMQNLDLGAFGRAVRCHGFEPMFIRHTNRSAMACLAALDPSAAMVPMGEQEREARIAMYREWRERSVLALPAGPRALFDEASAGKVLAYRARGFSARAGAGVRSLLGGGR